MDRDEQQQAGADEPAHWTRAQVAQIDREFVPEIALVGAADVVPLIDGVDVWDAWPITHPDGSVAIIDDAEHWIMLSAAIGPDPLRRHDTARMRHLTLTNGHWADLDNLLPDGLTPGPREWAGSAVFARETRQISLYYTVTGRHGEALSFEQRLFETSGTLGSDGRTQGWSAPLEIVASDGDIYCDTRTTQGEPGMIKAFRDPAWFRDPRDGQAWLTFAGSDGRSAHIHNGVAGVARQDGTAWTLLPPILSADGVCNELERPHLISHDGRYYLFWSTQRHVFAPGASGPNGLYGAVADDVLGPYRMLNGTGLVAANPAAEPTQCYSWLVMADLSVASFIDYWGMIGRTVEAEPALVRAQFGGNPAPRFNIWLDGDRAGIA